MGPRPVPPASAASARSAASLGVKRTGVVDKKAKFSVAAGKRAAAAATTKAFSTFPAGPSSSGDPQTYFSPVKGGNLQTLDMLAALTATPVRAKLDQDPSGAASPSKDALMSPLSFPSQCKRRRTAAAMAANAATVYAQQQHHHLGLLIPNAVWAGGAQLGVPGATVAGFQAPPGAAGNMATLFPQMAATAMAAGAAAAAAEAQHQQDQQQEPAPPPFGETLRALPALVGEQEEGSTKWLDLLVADIKGRLAALKRSKTRIAKVQERQANELLRDMQIKIEEELMSLQRWLKQVKEMKSVGSTQALVSTAIKLSCPAFK